MQIRLVEALKTDKKLQRLLIIGLAVKVFIILLTALAYFSLPFNEGMRQANFIYPEGSRVGLQSAYTTWDGTHYIYLAEQGYAPGQMSNAFYPLYPLLLRLLGPVFSGTLIAGLLLSGVLSLFALCYLYMFVKERMNEQTAFVSGALFLAFPTAFFTSLLYAEALFILLAVMLFYYLYRGNTLQSTVCAFLLPLTRPQGILIAIPVLVFILTRKKKRTLFSFTSDKLPLFGLAAGFAAYLLLMKIWAGSWLAGFKAQQAFIAGNSILNAVDIFGWFMRNFVNVDWALHSYTGSIIDRLFFLAFLVVLYYIYKRLDRTMFWYAAVLGLVPALCGSFMAYTRYLLVVFPIFIALAVRFKKKWWALLVPMAGLQAIFIVMHSLNYWIA
ncbi:glycosyltransferase family 39 protein [Candidatus Woesearchaeota archaeon]|nr:glycosyltransferase family 39 protein [Candidatus Woesearchaeota archaeon]